MERKTFLKLEKGTSTTITVREIKKQEVLNLVADEGIVTIFSEEAKAYLRTLWNADKANPHGPLVGKKLTISRPERGGMTIQLASSTNGEDMDDDSQIPF